MKRNQTFLLVSLVILVAGMVAIVGSGNAADAPFHDSTSDAAGGTSALRQLASALGHPVSEISDRFDLPSQPGSELIMLSPARALEPGEVNRLMNFIESGGRLLFAAEAPDARLRSSLGLQLQARSVASVVPIGRLFPGVHRVESSRLLPTLVGGPDAVPLLRAADGSTMGMEVARARGRAIVVTEPCWFCNSGLERADNAALAAHLLGDARSQVVFDEFHHVPPGRGGDLTSATWARVALAVLLVVFAAIGLRGRRFGPAQAVHGDPDRPITDHSAAVGALLRRNRGGAVAAGILTAALHRHRSGLQFQPRRSEHADWPALERELTNAGADEARLLRAARRLHAAMYPRERVAARPISPDHTKDDLE